MFHSEDIGEKR